MMNKSLLPWRRCHEVTDEVCVNFDLSLLLKVS